MFELVKRNVIVTEVTRRAPRDHARHGCAMNHLRCSCAGACCRDSKRRVCGKSAHVACRIAQCTCGDMCTVSHRAHVACALGRVHGCTRAHPHPPTRAGVHPRAPAHPRGGAPASACMVSCGQSCLQTCNLDAVVWSCFQLLCGHMQPGRCRLRRRGCGAIRDAGGAAACAWRLEGGGWRRVPSVQTNPSLGSCRR
jgi:hypothetical protein